MTEEKLLAGCLSSLCLLSSSYSCIMLFFELPNTNFLMKNSCFKQHMDFFFPPEKSLSNNPHDHLRNVNCCRCRCHAQKELHKKLMAHTGTTISWGPSLEKKIVIKHIGAGAEPTEAQGLGQPPCSPCPISAPVQSMITNLANLALSRNWPH